MPHTLLTVTFQVIAVLERLDIPYAIGGSLASAAHGVIRTTIDADIVTDLQSHHISDFVTALQQDFYVDEQMIQDAVIRRASFNVLHLDTMFKVDIFIAKPRSFDLAQLTRKQLLTFENSLTAAYVITAEDIILAKLEWYRLGNQISDRQWLDVLGVIKVQGTRLDQDYLSRMADTLRVRDLLERALAEATG